MSKGTTLQPGLVEAITRWPDRWDVDVLVRGARSLGQRSPVEWTLYLDKLAGYRFDPRTGRLSPVPHLRLVHSR